MYHIIEFDEALTLDLRPAGEGKPECVSVKKGLRLRARLRPRVLEAEGGPVEAADLLFEDGTSLRSVPFASFCFVDCGWSGPHPETAETPGEAEKSPCPFFAGVQY